MKLEDMTEPELWDVCNRAAAAVEGVLGKGSKFVILMFDDPKVAQYVSTYNRQDMLKALRETVERFERREDVLRARPERPHAYDDGTVGTP